MCIQDPKFLAMHRRQLLAFLTTVGAHMVVGCSGNDFKSAVSSTTPSGTSGSNPILGTTSGADSSGITGTTSGGQTSACVEVAEETNGPFPADGTNSAGDGVSTKLDLVNSSTPIFRSSISESYPGIPLTLNIVLQNVSDSCATLPAHYIYIWHCTAAGVYSAYSGANNGGTHLRTETYMRGIQKTDSTGQVTFQTIYPGWYSGRAIHIHVEVFRNLDDAMPIKVSQFAFPMDINRIVAGQTSYGYKGVSGMTDNSGDGIFADGVSTEMLTISSNSSTGGYNGFIALKVKA